MGILNFFKKQPSELVDKSSKGFVKSYSFSQTTDTSVTKVTDYELLLKIFTTEPIIISAVNLKLDYILSSGYSVSGSLSKKDFHKYGLNYPFLRQLIYNLLVYEEAYIEIGKNKGHPYFYLLETSQMSIIYDRNGNIKGYVQKTSSGEKINFKPDEIVYIALNKIGSDVFGTNLNTSLFNNFSTKTFLQKYILFCSSKNLWKPIFVSKDINEETSTQLLSSLMNPVNDFSPIIISSSNEELKITKYHTPKEMLEITEILNDLRKEILAKLGVPSVMLGFSTGTTQADFEAQKEVFYNSIKSFRNLLEHYINNELFEKAGIDAEFYFLPLDKRSEKEDILIAEKLAYMGADKDKIEEYLRNTGIELPEGKIFTNDDKLYKDKDIFPSRTRKQKYEYSGEYKQSGNNYD